MDDKKLNFNRPLLSVRRFATETVDNSQKNSSSKNGTSVPAPPYKSEMQSGSLRKPGSVPFVWEQSPGRPKHEAKPQKQPTVPKLPPGRIIKPKKQDLDTITKDFIGTKGGLREGSRTQLRDDGYGNNSICSENEKPKVTYGPNFLQLNDEKVDDDDDNEEDSESDYDERDNMSYKICGLLPQFCLKGSVGILNPIPGLSVRTRLPISSSSATRLAATVPVYENRSLVKPPKDQNTVNNGSPEATNQKNSQKPESAPLKKGLVSFKELLAHDNENKSADFQNPEVEKTLYVDTIRNAETAKSDFSENDMGIFGISHTSTESFNTDVHDDDTLKQDKEIITETCIVKLKDPKRDQNVKISQRKNKRELPTPPPLPKSPSDSWLWRTLPSLSSKPASLRSNSNYPSKTTAKLDSNLQSQYPQGILLPIPET